MRFLVIFVLLLIPAGARSWEKTALDRSGHQLGRPLRLTWSLVPDGTITPGFGQQEAGPSNLVAWLDGLYPGGVGEDLARRPWFALFQEAAAAFEAQCGVRLVYEPADNGAAVSNLQPGVVGVRGDIRFSARALDGPGKTLAFGHPVGFGDLVFDSSDNHFDDLSNDSVAFFNVLCHELGHSLGLFHVCPPDGTKLMEFKATQAFRGPQRDEQLRLHRIFGDRLERRGSFRTNDRAGLATFLGSPGVGVKSWPALSLSSPGDEDFFRISVSGREFSAQAVARGGAGYQVGIGVADACGETSLFEPEKQRELRLAVLSGDGGTLLGQGGELITLPPNTMEVLVRVSALEREEKVQMYDLQAALGELTPQSRLMATAVNVMAESTAPANDRLDPGEVVEVEVLVENQGTAAFSGGEFEVAKTFEAGRAMVLRAPARLGPLEVGEQKRLTLAVVLPDLVATEYLVQLPFADGFAPLELVLPGAEIGERMGEREDFLREGLPPNWQDGSGRWTRRTDVRGAENGALFLPGRLDEAMEVLVSPKFTLGVDAEVRMRHRWEFEPRRDGAVLRVIFDDEGVARDLLAMPEVTVTNGGYDSTMRSSAHPMLREKRAWSGERTSFVTTVVELPDAWTGREVRFELVAAFGVRFQRAGWVVDEFLVSSRPLLFRPADPDGIGAWLGENQRHPLGDQDGNGQADALDFLLETSGGAPEEFSLLRAGGSGQVELLAPRVTTTRKGGLLLTLERSTDLVNWTREDFPDRFAPRRVDGGEVGRAYFRLGFALDAAR